jgi:hypothetical protein
MHVELTVRREWGRGEGRYEDEEKKERQRGEPIRHHLKTLPLPPHHTRFHLESVVKRTHMSAHKKTCRSKISLIKLANSIVYCHQTQILTFQMFYASSFLFMTSPQRQNHIKYMRQGEEE